MTGTIASNVNDLVGNVNDQVGDLLSGDTGLLIGGIIGLIVLTLIIGYVKGWFGGRRS